MKFSVPNTTELKTVHLKKLCASTPKLQTMRNVRVHATELSIKLTWIFPSAPLTFNKVHSISRVTGYDLKRLYAAANKFMFILFNCRQEHKVEETRALKIHTCEEHKRVIENLNWPQFCSLSAKAAPTGNCEWLSTILYVFQALHLMYYRHTMWMINIFLKMHCEMVGSMWSVFIICRYISNLGALRFKKSEVSEKIKKM